ncbi:MAG: hypothetical protein ACQCN6_07575 [Candidatus Bathyarchaeia archaeon]
MTKIKQAASEFKDTVVNYFKDNNVEVKDWKFSVEHSEANYIVDASVKIVIKPKKPE